jgi:hypothetical protein
MVAFYYLFDWLGRHPGWTAFGLFVLVTTISISLIFDKRRRR